MKSKYTINKSINKLCATKIMNTFIEPGLFPGLLNNIFLNVNNLAIMQFRTTKRKCRSKSVI